MIALALLAGIAVQSPLPIAPVAPATVRPIGWSALPPLPFRRMPHPTPRMTAFVAAELLRSDCPPPLPVDGRMRVQVDVAVLVGDGGVIRAAIPRAIACPTVEQYAAGLISSFARGNLVPRLVGDGGWYRASMVFDWPA